MIFDRLVTPESVFPDSAQRKQFQLLPPSGSADERSYVFQFIPVKGMNASRHFLLLTITWTKATSPKDAQPVLLGVGGPGGGFVDAVAQTDDHIWNLRVSLGSLMPAGVEAPEIAPVQIASELLRIYQSNFTAQ